MITVKRFTAKWCGPCRMLAPIMNNLETEYPQVTFEVIDTEESPLEVTKYDIRSIPTVIILKDDVDFLVEGKYIVECYGDFWHCNPQRYSAEYFNKGKRKTATEVWKRDACRKQKFEELGYTFLHVWESEINGDPKAVRNKIKKLIKNKG